MREEFSGLTLPIVLLVILAFAVLFYGCVPSHAEEGIASVYGYESGNRRADGHPFNPAAIGCAHRTRRLGSVARVTVVRTGRSIMCVVNDRGPAAWTHRIIDLSVGAARALGVKGLAHVRVE